MSSGRDRLFISLYTDEDVTTRLASLLHLLDQVTAEEMWNTVRNLQSYR